MDAYNPREALVTWLREHGVTTVNTGHAPMAVIPGQTMIVKTLNAPVADAVVRPTATIAATLGNSARAAGGKSPGTIAKQAALLRGALVRAREYLAKRKAMTTDKPVARDLPSRSTWLGSGTQGAALDHGAERPRHPHRASNCKRV